MKLGRVVGTLVPAVVYEGLAGVPMLWVQPLTKDGQVTGRPIVCADGTRMAGPGELVCYESSREGALTLDPWFVPVDDAVVGIVDGVHLAETDPAEVDPAGPGPAGEHRSKEHRSDERPEEWS